MFWERFIKECERVGKKPNPIAKELGISSGTITNWKNGSTPSNSALLKLSNYFGVSTDYLLGKTTFNPGDVVEVNLNLKKDLGHGETRFIHSMENHNIARSMLNSIVVDPQEQMLLDIFRNTTEEGKLRIIQSIMNIRDEIEKKSVLSNTAHNE